MIHTNLTSQCNSTLTTWRSLPSDKVLMASYMHCSDGTVNANQTQFLSVSNYDALQYYIHLIFHVHFPNPPPFLSGFQGEGSGVQHL